MAKKAKGTYLEVHKRVLRQVVEDYEINRQEMSFFSSNEYAIFNNIESGITKHPLRSYQMEALYTLDYLLKTNEKRPEKQQLLEVINLTTDEKAPFLSFEMATGSGKTMLMGASIYLLNKKFGINNFLIITPASTDIYQKTIRNFTVGTFESVWADDTPFTFNLITGDDYKENLQYDESKDANIFVFNISKFGTNAINTEKMWESSIWKDDNGNNISIKQFLKEKKLVIITDEAHHAQTPAAMKIIKNFHPNAVLEYTATAVEAVRGQDKKNQQIVYRYDIREFLEDGHGKLVRAIALASEFKKTKEDVAPSEKLKLITLMLIHLLKKKAVLLDPKCRSLKPLAFIKVKDDTVYTQKVFDYIKNDLSNDKEFIKTIIQKLKSQDLDITNLVSDLLKDDYNNDLNQICKEIQSIANTVIFYHGKSDKETEKKFNEIRNNEVEIVVYMQRLDEGIDIPNIYTMAVINDTESNFKTSVKQIIGRGVRLNKNVREFDDSGNPLQQQCEKLHIVCDQGKNFEEIISSIQKEFGLNNKYFSSEQTKKEITNKAKTDLLKNKYVPHVKAVFKVKEGVSLIGLIQDSKTIIDAYLEANSFKSEDDQSLFIKYRPSSFFVEVDVFSDKEEFHSQIRNSGGQVKEAIFSEKQLKGIYAIVQKTLHCLPDTGTVKAAFQAYIDRLNELKLKYYWIDSSDDELVMNLFVNSFAYFYKNHIEKNYYSLTFEEIDPNQHQYLSKHFKDIEIKIPSDQVKNKTREKVKEKAKLIELIDQGYNFHGYKKSIYDYDSFDSFPEKQLAEYVDDTLANQEVGNRFFWIRNQRNIHFTYGSKRYYPDFIVFKDDYIYVIETKGEIFSDTRKNFLLKKLDEVQGEGEIKGFKGLLVFSKQLDELEFTPQYFDDFIKQSEDVLMKMQTLTDLVENPPVGERFKKYIPAYSPIQAFKKFNKNSSTVKPEGWLEVKELESNYPDNVFSTQVKGSSLEPKYRHNDWILLVSSKNIEEANDNFCLSYSDSILDSGYGQKFIISKVKLTEKAHRGTFLKERNVHLIPENSDTDALEIVDVRSEDDFQIIATEFKI